MRGTAGFGGQAVAVPLLALIMPLTTALAALVVLTAMSAVGHLRRDWPRIDDDESGEYPFEDAQGFH